MRSPYGLDIVDCCSSCSLRTISFFCNFSTAALHHFDQIKFASAFPSRAVLFVEGQAPRGIFVLCQGQVKQSICSREGKILIMKIAEPGEVLGLSATLSGKPYEQTAETTEPSQVSFVKRDDFLRFLHQQGDACLRAAGQLSKNYHAVCHEARLLGLTHSVREKLAKWLLELVPAGGTPTNQPTKVRLPLTHEEIAQTIGTSRETVTRLFADLRRRNIVEMNGVTLVVRNRAALERVVAAP
jgi:CRP/FNR family transcriptional regulator, cyclic AMP receptor protein